ncbi:hypothetical protein VCV18_006457 [Metarhizium anisopliae]
MHIGAGSDCQEEGGEGPGANIERIGNRVEGNGARASAASLRMMAFVDVGKLVLVLVVNSGL